MIEVKDNASILPLLEASDQNSQLPDFHTGMYDNLQELLQQDNILLLAEEVFSDSF